MSNPELFNDDFWTTRSSQTRLAPSTGGSCGKDDPPSGCESQDDTTSFDSDFCCTAHPC